MRILTDVPEAELKRLTNQPTAKALTEKIKTEGIYIPEGDAAAAETFTAMRESRRRDVLDISDDGKAAIEKTAETKERTSREEQIKKKITELQKELAEIKEQNGGSEKEKAARERKADTIEQQITALDIQLIQLRKNESGSAV